MLWSKLSQGFFRPKHACVIQSYYHYPYFQCKLNIFDMETYNVSTGQDIQLYQFGDYLLSTLYLSSCHRHRA